MTPLFVYVMLVRWVTAYLCSSRVKQLHKRHTSGAYLVALSAILVLTYLCIHALWKRGACWPEIYVVALDLGPGARYKEVRTS